MSKSMLWWGRFGPGYSRSSILRKILQSDGWEIRDFHPKSCRLADLEAGLRRIECPSLVWVPCSRQRDLAAAHRFARRMKVPLVFDPLISYYDKQVFENRKLEEGSAKARRLKRWESHLFQLPDAVLADTQAHADYFTQELGVDLSKLVVVPVGAEEDLFVPQPPNNNCERKQVLFYGTFLPLQGVDTVVAAARLVPEADWILLGKGKLRAGCEEAARGMDHIRFEDWMSYNEIPQRIGQADILLGVFGDTPKAARVLPNKFYQAIACARPIITMDAPVYTNEVRATNRGGITFVPPADPEALAAAVRELIAKSGEALQSLGANARALYETYYGEDRIRSSLMTLLDRLSL